jgi:NAD(P)-dependent dehydrogenase (short-subunit alcohol dehydrogenase family)
MMLSNVEKGFQVANDQNGQNLRGKAVVIIGDADGVGLATAVMLAERGAPVFLAARSAVELKRALAAINQAGGEGDGMVVDVSRADDCRRFFMLAEGWLGRVDAVVNPTLVDEWVAAPTPEVGSKDLKSANVKSAGSGLASGLAISSQNLCMEEAIRRMQTRGYGHIVNINLASASESNGMPELRAAANLRRQASEQGIRVTTIEPGGGTRRGPAPTQDVLSAEDIARCVLDSLSQPFRVDRIVLPGQLQKQAV